MKNVGRYIDSDFSPHPLHVGWQLSSFFFFPLRGGNVQYIFIYLDDYRLLREDEGKGEKSIETN